MTPDEAVAALDAMNGDDPEAAHAVADSIVLAFAPLEVRLAWERLVGRCDWWAYA